MRSPALPSALPPSAGVGLKPCHYQSLLADLDDGNAPVGWVEIHPQNYFGPAASPGGGPPHRWLSAIAAHLPLSFHSVGLSLGSAEGLDQTELEQLAALAERYRPAMLSDHLSWSGHRDDKLPDLLTLPYTQESLDHFTRQVEFAQRRLKRPLLIENPSRLLQWAGDSMDEIAFIARLIDRTGCGLLFDINNVVVSAGNLGFDAGAYVDAIDPAWVGEVHLAGHSVEQHDSGPLYIDDHGSCVGECAMALFADFAARAGPLPVLIEWDNEIPDYAVLMAEAQRAQAIMNAAALPLVNAAHAR